MYTCIQNQPRILARAIPTDKTSMDPLLTQYPLFRYTRDIIAPALTTHTYGGLAMRSGHLNTDQNITTIISLLHALHTLQVDPYQNSYRIHPFMLEMGQTEHTRTPKGNYISYVHYKELSCSVSVKLLGSTT